MSSPSTDKLNVALCQFLVGRNKAENLSTAKESIYKAAEGGAQLIILPECFNCPYSTLDFPEYSEPIPEVHGDSTQFQGTVKDLSSWAKELGVYIVGGSIPESSDGKIFNTATVFDPKGEMIAKHRKLHLFDIDIPGKMTFRESDSLTPGEGVTLFDIDPESLKSDLTRPIRVGLGICYDMRFSEYAQACTYNGAMMLIYPGAFNLVTGPAHWELLQRGRAIDNQVYVATCSPARADPSTEGYKAWGHSSVVSPWGDVIATCDEHPAVVSSTLDFQRMDEIRQNIPISKQKRFDVYSEPRKL